MATSKMIFRGFVTLTVALSALSFASCASKKTASEDNSVPNSAAADENTATGDSDSGKALGMQTIHFPYDAFTLDSEAKTQTKSNAQILKDHTSVKIQIEGHCDQRGGIQYNMALGEKRANAVKKYLEDVGIKGDRVTVVSFGKEHLLDNGTSDEAYAKNRRANFVITTH